MPSEPAPASLSVANHIKKIGVYHDGTIRAFKDQIGYAFLCGLFFLSLKETVAHGEFEKLCQEKLPKISSRSRVRYMTFTSGLMSKSAIVADLARNPRLMTSPEIAEEDTLIIFKAVHDSADAKSMTAFLRDLKLIHEPKSPDAPNKCEHCSKPVSPTATTCPHCKKDINPKLTAKEIAEAELAQANDWVNNQLGRIRTLLDNPKLAGRISDARKQVLIAAHVGANNFLRGKLNTRQQAATRDLIDWASATPDLPKKDLRSHIKALKK